MNFRAVHDLNEVSSLSRAFDVDAKANSMKAVLTSSNDGLGQPEAEYLPDPDSNKKRHAS